MTATLKHLRQEITQIDHDIISLLSKRMFVSKRIAEHKKENNLPIFDPKREKELLDNYQTKVDFDITWIYLAIFAESKRVQNENL